MHSEGTDLRTISRYIFRGLKLCGKSAYSSRLCQNQTNLLDTIWAVREKPKLRLYHGGSTAEGTTTTSSDVDRMAVISGIKAITTQDYGEDGCQNLFLIDSSKSNPGYVRLLAANPSELKHDDFGDFKIVLDETPNGKYLSNDKFVDFLHSLNAPSESRFSEFYYRHGPCLMVEHLNIFGYHRDTPGERLETDVAFALVLDDWPEEAREWVTRKRCHGWPSQDVIDKISRQECHAVAVGDPTSDTCSQEWRISFLLGERELVWNFNDTQIQTYIISKLLLKKYIDRLAPDQLSSYHLKTIMFWMIEEEGNSQWYEENLLGCISSCLGRLGKCIEKGMIEHYFHRSRNLLRYKLRDASERSLVQNEIAAIINQIAKYTLNGGLIPASRVYKLWSACNGDLKVLIQICSRDVELTTYFNIVMKVNDSRRRFMSLFNMYVNTTACCDSLEVLLMIAEELKSNVAADVDSSCLEITLRFLDIRIGFGYYHLSKQDLDLSNATDLLEKCREKLVAAGEIDDLSGVLYLATFYFCMGQFTLCQDAVNRGMPQVGRYLYTGRCSKNHGIEIEAGKLIFSPEVPVTGEDDEIIKPAFDIVFTKQDTEYVPYIVKFECALLPEIGDRFFVYHPCVYSYGLKYLTHTTKRDTDQANHSLECLAQVVRDLGITPQRFRALNLLGHCYALKGDLNNAISCFLESLQDTASMTGVTNAAAYHLVLLLFGTFLKAEKDESEIIYTRC